MTEFGRSIAVPTALGYFRNAAERAVSDQQPLISSSGRNGHSAYSSAVVKLNKVR